MTLPNSPTISTDPATRTFLRVREIRLAKGISVQQIADSADVSYNTALAYDRDNAIMIRKDIIFRIADALGVKVNELFADS